MAQSIIDIISGNNDAVVGTHALIQEKVAYHKLGFAVIDEHTDSA